MMLREARKRKLEAQDVSWEDEPSASSDSGELQEPCYSSDEDSRRGRVSISWTGALEARFLKALQQAGGVWEAKPKAILQRMGAYSTQLTTIQVKSHLQKHRIKVAAQMQAQGLPVPTPGNGAGGATPAVAAAAQQVAAARAAQLQGQPGTAQQRAAPPKARRPRAPPAGSVVSAEPAVMPPPRRSASHQAARAAAAAGTARHAQQQQQQQQQAQLQQQQYAESMQRRQLVANRQQSAAQHQWAAGGLAAPATPQQMHYGSPGLQQLVEVEVAQPFSLGHGEQGRSRGHHSHGHGQLAHHAARALHAGQHSSGYAGQGGGLELHPVHSMGQLAPAGLPPQLDAAAGPSHQGSPVTAASSGGAPTGSAGSDWEALLRMDNLPSPHLLAASRHGSLMRLHGGGAQHEGGLPQYGSAGVLTGHPPAPMPPPLATHPTAPASLWTAADAEGWPQLGGPAGVPQPHMPAQQAVTVLASSARHHAPPLPAPNHTSDSDSDHYADLGDLLDMPALLAGGDDGFGALAAGLGSPGGAAASGGLPGHPTAASSWAIDTSPFF